MKTLLTFALVFSILSPAIAIECTRAPDRTPGAFWRYRIIENQQCWYRSESMVQTVSYRADEQHQDEEGRHIARMVILAGFVTVIAGMLFVMFWAVRSQRGAA